MSPARPRLRASDAARIRATTAAAAVALMLVSGWLLSPPVAGAAGPSPTPETVPGELVIQAWLDQQLPPDVPVGHTLEIGATLWNPVQRAIQTMSSGYVRVHAAKGSGMGPDVPVMFDWPGHLIAQVTVPKGGLGKIEVGVPGKDCDPSGNCRKALQPFTFGGYGPPPDARRTDLVVASIEDLPGTLKVGDTVTVTADLVPKANWSLDSLALPDRLVLEATPPRGSDLAQVDLQQSQPFDGSYHGSLTIPDASDLALKVSIPAAGGGPGLVFPAVVRVAVLGATNVAASVSPAASGVVAAAPAAPGPDIPWIPIVLVVVVILGGGYVLTRVLADL